MPLGDMNIIHFKDSERAADCRFIGRSLDLETAVSVTEYAIGEVEFKREMFISQPDQVLVLHMTASQKGAINVRVRIDGRDDYFDDNSPSTTTISFSAAAAEARTALILPLI